MSANQTNKLGSIGGILVRPFSSVAHAAAAVIDDQGHVSPGFAVAINAEKVVRYREDPELRTSVDSASIRFADGAPIAWILSRLGFASSRIAGVDLWKEIMARAGTFGTPVFLLGAAEDVNEETAALLMELYGTPVAGRANGYFQDSDAMVGRIRNSGARIVTVAMGSPRQEQFIAYCREQYPEAFYLGVGGTYDVFSGRIPRAPRFFRDHGLEWLYRLAKQPSRLIRQAALFRFVALYLQGRLDPKIRAAVKVVKDKEDRNEG